MDLALVGVGEGGVAKMAFVPATVENFHAAEVLIEEEAEKNMPFILVTEDMSQSLMDWLKFDAYLNMLPIWVTWLTNCRSVD